MQLAIYPEGELEFFYTVVPTQAKFVKDKKGVVRKLVMSYKDERMEAIRQ